MMDNKRLNFNGRSEQFIEDGGVTINKRCFVLMGGKDDNEGAENNAITAEIRVNLLDDETSRKKIAIKIRVDTVITEMCSDVIKSWTALVPEFRAYFRYGELIKYSPKHLSRKIAYRVPLYIMKMRYLKEALNATEE